MKMKHIRHYINLIENSKKLTIDIIKPVGNIEKAKACKIIYRNVEQGSWELDENLNPIIILEDKLKNVKWESEDDKNTYLYHKFFGVIPHEYEEAMLSLLFMTNTVKNSVCHLRANYPNFLIKNYVQKYLIQYGGLTYEEALLLRRNDFKKFEQNIDILGGIAHEAIVSYDHQAYYKYLNMINKKYGLM